MEVVAFDSDYDVFGHGGGLDELELGVGSILEDAADAPAVTVPPPHSSVHPATSSSAPSTSIAAEQRVVGHLGAPAGAVTPQGEVSDEEVQPPPARRRRLNAKTTVADAQRAGYAAASSAPLQSSAAAPPSSSSGAGRDSRPQADLFSVPPPPIDSHALYGRGHRLSVTAGVVWCRTCGRHAAAAVRALAKPCAGAASGAYFTRLKRLRDGRHPLTGLPLE